MGKSKDFPVLSAPSRCWSLAQVNLLGGLQEGIALAATLTPLPGQSATIPWSTGLIQFELVGHSRCISDFPLLVFVWLCSTLPS